MMLQHEPSATIAILSRQDRDLVPSIPYADEGEPVPTTTCESCGMPIETGPYCEHCVDADGRLQDFDTRFDRMVGWAQRKGADRATAEAQTRDYMRGMPAWRDHPRLVEGR